MKAMKDYVANLPLLGPMLRGLRRTIVRFPGSATYWDERYASGGDSGPGSYGKFAEFKSEVINTFVAKNQVSSIIEFGCGDGNQLTTMLCPRYLGLDVSKSAVEMCRHRFSDDPSKQFKLIKDYANETADLAISLDVIFHIVEDSIFEEYMRKLFRAADRFVIVYSSNTDEIVDYTVPHIRHRRFTNWVECNLPDWALMRHIPNRYPYEEDYTEGSFSDFFIFRRNP